MLNSYPPVFPYSETMNDFTEPAPPPDMKEICSKYGASIFFRRWAAMVLDAVIGLCLLGIPFIIRHYYGEDAYYTAFGVFTLCCLFYYLFLEGYSGYTFGKFALRIRVVNQEGRAPGFVKSLLRTLLRLFEVNPFFIGGLPAGISVLASQKKQRLGDMAANTYVVRTRDLEQEAQGKTTAMIVFFSGMLLVALVSAVWGLYAIGAESGKLKMFHSSDRQFHVSAPSGWTADKSLNEDADIAISNRYSEKYLLVMSESKDDFDEDMTVKDFENLVERHMMKQLDGARMKERPYPVTVNGNDGYQFVLQGKVDGYSITYIITALETSDHFHQIHTWTESAKYERVREELLNIVSSFSDAAEISI